MNVATKKAVLGDPKGMRPSERRADFPNADPKGYHRTNSGRLVTVLWLACSGQHCHIVIWDEKDPTFDMVVVNGVIRAGAHHKVEKLLTQL